VTAQKSIRVGDLQRQVTIQTRTATQDTFGQQSVAWTDMVATWAAIEPLSGRELLAAEAVAAEVTHQVVIRYRTGISAANRIVYQGRIFDVHSVIDENMNHRKIVLLCSEGLTPG
jgi:SPP1 family predicted phage head-tail adaptor